MRILVLSDSHGDFRRMYRVIEQHKDIDNIFFLGDGIKEFEDICDIYPQKKLRAVSGNCDFMSMRPSTNLCKTSKGLILYTHGDAYGVKSGIGKLLLAATERGARLALFGHTHERYAEKVDDIYLFNPGSLGKSGSYGICELSEKEITMLHYVM